MTLPTFADVLAAADRIRPHVHRTPVLRSTYLERRLGGELHFKCESFQRAGAFKFRGACNAVLSLTEEEARRGVVTHSSGNHAQALALAASLRGIAATIVMPANANPVKVAAVEGYGGRVVRCEPTLVARETTAARVIEETGALLVHPYDDPRVIAGQGTAALELLEEVLELDAVVAPLGGGGLLSGTLLACAGCAPRTAVYGVEPEGAADGLRSLEEGRIVPSVDPRTVADGLLTSLGVRTFAIIRDHVRAVVTVDDATIIEAMRLVWERMKIVVEPSAAVPLAALLAGKIEARGKRIGVIFSGGNVDVERLPWGR
jgi:threonine dehydratase